jgi:hypothetical protein
MPGYFDALHDPHHCCDKETDEKCFRRTAFFDVHNRKVRKENTPPGAFE